MKTILINIIDSVTERRDNAITTHAFNLGFLGYENTLHHSLFVLEIELLNFIIMVLNSLK